MKAAQARRLAKNVKAGKVKPLPTETELEAVMRQIKESAGNGQLTIYVDMDAILEQATIDELLNLGYDLEDIQTRPTARPRWKISWERKAA